MSDDSSQPEHNLHLQLLPKRGGGLFRQDEPSSAALLAPQCADATRQLEEDSERLRVQLFLHHGGIEDSLNLHVSQVPSLGECVNMPCSSPTARRWKIHAYIVCQPYGPSQYPLRSRHIFRFAGCMTRSSHDVHKRRHALLREVGSDQL